MKMNFKKPEWWILATEKILVPMSFYFFLVLLFLFGFLSNTLFNQEKAYRPIATHTNIVHP